MAGEHPDGSYASGDCRPGKCRNGEQMYPKEYKKYQPKYAGVEITKNTFIDSVKRNPTQVCLNWNSHLNKPQRRKAKKRLDPPNMSAGLCLCALFSDAS